MKRIWEITIVLIGGTFIIVSLKFILNLPTWLVLVLGAIYTAPLAFRWAEQDIKNLNRRQK